MDSVEIVEIQRLLATKRRRTQSSRHRIGGQWYDCSTDSHRLCWVEADTQHSAARRWSVSEHKPLVCSQVVLCDHRLVLVVLTFLSVLLHSFPTVLHCVDWRAVAPVDEGVNCWVRSGGWMCRTWQRRVHNRQWAVQWQWQCTAQRQCQQQCSPHIVRMLS